MKITIACVGKIKEKYLTAGIEEFSKRLTPFCKLETLAINEERMPDNPSPAEKQQVLERETQRLLAIIPANSYVILLDVIGKQLSSPDLAAKLDELALAGNSHITFVIGGTFGYTDALRKRADWALSFSKMTFTHQMIRLLLIEQIYRAFKISRGEKYHW
ncbi:23S rRNA (pseudouridine(1915)-N(3))-methyltransferase RlmH [Phascolarctobacterium succinatutens]|uniref:23S rRNA (pseudouridine(1915)-N(3))-methyltransferase RlmH n=1 Tax=Phascolarctobacterium succinatutens TaxID=626940 RepID=UPI0026F07840|nr:23S rRNA (pseudouridine(1915)-N(3))-methyltransferase RlmH [Phascolarctobacterium succinatutens]